MNVLNKEVFNQTKKLFGLVVTNKLVNGFSKQFKEYLFSCQKFKPIVTTDNNEKKMIYLNDSIKSETDIPELLKKFIKENEKDIDIVEKDITLDYNNFSYEQVLKQLLPKEVSIPYSFERIGHIIHVNLKDEQLPYKHIIGQAILDKNIQVKTVLNKVGEIDTVFRTFKIEILAGEPDLIAEIKENECIFKFNFEEVYWNSRLQYEHMALVNTFKQQDIICDMFAGVGPFALPAAKIKKCKIYANDLNPSSVKYMKENCTNNQLDSKVVISNLDAREFVKSLLLNTDRPPVPFTQVIMNLPSTSIEFLDVFREIFLSSTVAPPIPPPIINCYTFTKQNDQSTLEKDTVKNVEDVIGIKLPSDYVCYEVRDVAPKKSMMRISFRMPTILPTSYISATTTTATTTTATTTNNDNNNVENSKKRKETTQVDDETKNSNNTTTTTTDPENNKKLKN